MPTRCIPPEICDQIVDFLKDNPETLKQCCLTSKSWVPRTRKHLFSVVKFCSSDDIEAWKKTFPDPSESPAHHTHTLWINCPEAGITAEAAKGGWVQTFSRVVRFEVVGNVDASSLEVYLAAFHNTLKSIHVASFSIPHSQVIDLIYGLPLLEDLTLRGYDSGLDEPPIISPPSTSPALTGTLELRLIWGIARVTNRLLDLPNGLHFCKLRLLSYSAEDFFGVGKLVEACSDSLESLDVEHGLAGVIFFSSPDGLGINSNFDPQVNPYPVQLTYQTRRSSKSSSFGAVSWALSGSPWRSKPQLNIKISNESRFTSLPLWPATRRRMRTPFGWKKSKPTRCGPTSTPFSFNSGNRIRFVQKSCTIHPAQRIEEEEWGIGLDTCCQSR